MKNKTVKALALAMTISAAALMAPAGIYAAEAETAAEETTDGAEETADAAEESEETDAEENTGETGDDQAAADNVAALIDKIYVQERTDTTDEDCTAAKEAWDALTDAQKELVEGENASPDYFGLDTGDASLDDARNADEIGGKRASGSKLWYFL